jgi:NAD-dependent SIR2 family protein deacetylase
LEGICPKCGLHYYGWSLDNPARQKCGKCGSPLQIIRDGVIAPKDIAPEKDNKATKFLAAPPI